MGLFLLYRPFLVPMPAVHTMLKLCSCKYLFQEAFPIGAYKLEYRIVSPMEEERRAPQLGARVAQSWGMWRDCACWAKTFQRGSLIKFTPLPFSDSAVVLIGSVRCPLIKNKWHRDHCLHMLAFFEFLPFPPLEGNTKSCVFHRTKALCNFKMSHLPRDAPYQAVCIFSPKHTPLWNETEAFLPEVSLLFFPFLIGTISNNPLSGRSPKIHS